MKKGILAEFLYPLLAVAAITVALNVQVPISPSRPFFTARARAGRRGNVDPWAFLYRYGNIPAFVIGGLGAMAFLLSFFSAKFQPDRKAATFRRGLSDLGSRPDRQYLFQGLLGQAEAG